MSRRAVVIGSNGPPGPNALTYAKSDATRLAQALSHPRCGFETHIVEDTSDPHQITRLLNATADLCQPDDTFAIYFSGHGVVESGTLLLMLDATDIGSPLLTGLLAEHITTAMRFCRARHKLLILDCCHAGAAFGTRWKNAGGEPVRDLLGPDQGGPTSYVAILASDRLERTREMDALNGGFLTGAICDAIDNHFDEADRDRDGSISLTDLMGWLQDRAKRHNEQDPQKRVPTPSLIGRQKGDIFISLEPTAWRPWEVTFAFDYTFVLVPARASSATAWLIGKTPVTNDLYRRFVTQGGGAEPFGQCFTESRRWRGPFYPWREPDFANAALPVVCVSYADTQVFATWYQEHARCLIGVTPTAVWDMAAFGCPHPELDPGAWEKTGVHHLSQAPARTDHAEARTNRLGAVDLLGNVWEWTAPYFQSDGLDLGPPLRSANIGGDFDSHEPDRWRERNIELRGGSFLDDLDHGKITITSGALHDAASTRHSDLGFRLAAEMPLDALPADIAMKISNCRLLESSAPPRFIPYTA